MRQAIRLLLAALALVLGGSAGAADPVTLRIGVVSERQGQPDYTLSQYRPLVEILRQRLFDRSIGVELRVAEDLNGLVQSAQRGEVDAVMESLFPTFALERANVRLDMNLAAWRRGSRDTHSVFFVRNDSPYRTLGDLKGRVLALESPRSTTAFALPRAELRRAGLASVAADSARPPPGALRYILAGDETNQAYWVAGRKADVGAFNITDWNDLPEKLRQELRIIHTTQPILRWVWSFRQDLPPPIKTAVADALLKLHEDAAGKAALAAARNIVKFDRIDETDRKHIAAWRRFASGEPQ